MKHEQDLSIQYLINTQPTIAVSKLYLHNLISLNNYTFVKYLKTGCTVYSVIFKSVIFTCTRSLALSFALTVRKALVSL